MERSIRPPYVAKSCMGVAKKKKRKKGGWGDRRRVEGKIERHRAEQRKMRSEIM